MENAAVLDRSRLGVLGANPAIDMSDPSARESFVEGAESSIFGWIENVIGIADDTEGPTVFESADAMRFGPRSYSDEQFERIHQATAHQAEPIAPPIPLDD